MPDREKVIRAVDSCFDYWLDQHRYIHPLELEHVRQIKADALAMLKEQGKQKFFVDESGKITPLPVVVRCKNCKHCDDIDMYGWVKCDKGETHDPNFYCADGERSVKLE